MIPANPVQSCPYCGTGMEPAQAHACPDCQSVHHAECWEHNGGCTTFGCRSAPADEAKISIDSATLSSLPQTDIYVMSHAVRLGPYRIEQFQDNVRAGNFTIHNLVWSPVNPQWIPLGQAMPSLFPQPFLPPIPPAMLAASLAGEKPAGGLGRLTYFACMVAVFVLALFLPLGHPEWVFPIFCIGCLIIMPFRAINIGHRGWYGLLVLVPLINYVIFAYFFAAPPNYAHTKKTDVAGYIIYGLYLAAWALLICGTVAALYYR